jgi:hypothetical protein
VLAHLGFLIIVWEPVWRQKKSRQKLAAGWLSSGSFCQAAPKPPSARGVG